MTRQAELMFSAAFLAAALAVGCTGGEGPTAPMAAAQPSATSTPATSTPVQGGVARGETHGQPFELDRAEMRNDILTLHGDDGRMFFVFLFLDEGESVAGRAFRVARAEIGDPHVHMHYRTADGIEIETFMDEYALELEFGQPTDGRIAGRIELRLPDEAGSFVAGSFEAKLDG